MSDTIRQPASGGPMTGSPWRILTYDVERFPFASIARQMLAVSDLSGLPAVEAPGSPRSDQDSEYHARFYDALELLLPTYRRFIRASFGDRLHRLYVQRVPTLRVQLPGSTAVRRWHRDGEYGHDSAETNYWVPLTAASGTNTIWIEGRPVAAGYGQIVVFPGARLLHGNTVNDTAQSRVSFDFRTLERSAYRPRRERTIAAGLRFVVGEYWDIVE